MYKQFATYEIALKMKELGFDEPCITYWGISSKRLIENGTAADGYTNSELTKYNICAPIWQQAIDYFRESHHLSINITDDYSSRAGGWIFKFYINDQRAPDMSKILLKNNFYWNSFSEAREAAILKAIEIVKERSLNSNH